MSSIAYGVLTKKREETAPVPKGETSLNGVKGYVDAVAAPVPAEVLAFHALALQFTTETVQSEGEGSVASEEGETAKTEDAEAVTIITDPTALKVVFIVLVIAACALYLVGHRRQHKGWHRADVARMLIPGAAFVVWTMLQKSTAFDAIAATFAETPRFLLAAGAAVFLGWLARELAYKADGSHP